MGHFCHIEYQLHDIVCNWACKIIMTIMFCICRGPIRVTSCQKGNKSYFQIIILNPASDCDLTETSMKSISSSTAMLILNATDSLTIVMCHIIDLQHNISEN